MVQWLSQWRLSCRQPGFGSRRQHLIYTNTTRLPTSVEVLLDQRRVRPIPYLNVPFTLNSRWLKDKPSAFNQSVYKIASPSVPCKRQTDWSKCCLCQTAKNDDLKSPPMHYSYSIEQDGYSMIARNIPLFQSINALPIILDPSRIDEGGGIEETLRRRQAQYHQSCRIMLNNTKL